jgi:hypothetical protein
VNMRIPIFLSYPKPHQIRQREFIKKVQLWLEANQLEPRTLGVSDYDNQEPLAAIRRLMLESNGLITIAFRRTLIKDGLVNASADVGDDDRHERAVTDQWLTSPYCHIEPAMAFQLGLPILIFREHGVIADGILEKGVVGTYMPSFNLDSVDDFLESMEWKQIMARWTGQVHQVVVNKGMPPKLF